MTCEQKLKQFFHNKIDWKFFNYLRDKLTPYEDAGFNIKLQAATYTLISLEKHKKNEIEATPVYTYVNSKSSFNGDFSNDNMPYSFDNFTSSNSFKTLSRYYVNGLIYILFINKDIIDTETIKEISRKIGYKCEFLNYLLYDNLNYKNYVIVKPK